VIEQSRTERGIPPSGSASLRAAQNPQKLTNLLVGARNPPTGGQLRNQFLRALFPCFHKDEPSLITAAPSAYADPPDRSSRERAGASADRSARQAVGPHSNPSFRSGCYGVNKNSFFLLAP